jgi:hypothetical protein
MALLEALMLRRVTLGAVRMLRRLLIALVILGGLFALGNVWMNGVAEHKAADQIRASLKLSETPRVSFDGFPILLRLLAGRIPHATVDATGVTVKGLRVARFHLQVDDLAVSLADLTAGRGRLRTSGGMATGDVTAADANAYLAKQHQGVTVAFSGSAVRVRTRARYGGTPHDVEASGVLTLEGTDLVFVPQKVTVDGGPPPDAIAARARHDAAFRVPIPALPGGVRPKRVVVRDGVARLEVDFGAITLDLNAL